MPGIPWLDNLLQSILGPPGTGRLGITPPPTGGISRLNEPTGLAHPDSGSILARGENFITLPEREYTKQPSSPHIDTKGGSGIFAYEKWLRDTGRVPEADTSGRPGNRAKTLGEQVTGLPIDEAGALVIDQEAIDRQAAVAAALKQLTAWGEGLGTMIDDRITNITGSVPRYSDEMAEQQKKYLNDLIQQQTRTGLQSEAEGLGLRGLQGGGQLSSAAAELQASALGEKATAARQTDLSQLTANQRAEMFEQSLINPLVEQEAKLQSAMKFASAEIERGNIPDHEFMWNIATGLETLEQTMAQNKEMLEFMREYVEAGKPGPWDYVGAGLQAYGAQAGAPMVSFMGATVPFLEDLDWQNLFDLGGGD